MSRLLYYVFFLLTFFVSPTVNGQERSYLFDSSDVTVVKMDINTQYSEYSPAFCGNGIIFSSNKPYAFGVVTVMESDSTAPDNLYYSSASDRTPNYLEKLNTQNQEGSACFDSINGILYYAGNIKVKNNFVLAIYSSKKSPNGSWGKPIPVLVPSGPFSYFHPCVLNSGKTLLVASDRDGGFGGIDLYISTNENGTWTNPVNIGSEINTPYNEAYPSFSTPGFLFFSSTGHGTIGGYDMFSCTWKDNAFGAITPVGNSLNSSADDFGLIFDPTKRMGYFSSNRDHNSGDDIYSFNVNWPTFSNCASYVKPRYCYTFSEENSLESEDAELFFYEWDFGDGGKARSLEADHCFSGPGLYTVELFIRDRKDTSFFMSQVSYEHEIEEKSGLQINCPDTIYVGDTIELNCQNSSIANHAISKYYWDLGDHYLLAEDKVTYIATISGEIPVQLGAVAYNETTPRDSTMPSYFCTEKSLVVGTQQQKQEWAERRALAISNPLFNTVEKAVFDLSALNGPEYSVFLGSSKDSLSMPRLGTGAIIRIIKEDTIFRYLYGSADSLFAIHSDYVAIKNLGIDSAFVIVLSEDTIVANQLTEKRDFLFTSKVASMLAAPIPANAITPITVVNKQPGYKTDTLMAYFQVGKSTGDIETNKMLDSLVASTIIKKGTTYQLVGFADNNGDAASNLALSNSRTKSIANRLIKNGIKSTHISTFSYGEEPPPNFVAILKKARHSRCVMVIRSTPEQ